MTTPNCFHNFNAKSSSLSGNDLAHLRSNLYETLECYILSPLKPAVNAPNIQVFHSPP